MDDVRNVSMGDTAGALGGSTRGFTAGAAGFAGGAGLAAGLGGSGLAWKSNIYILLAVSVSKERNRND